MKLRTGCVRRFRVQNEKEDKTIQNVLPGLKLSNAKQEAKIYYGLHMVPGVAEYENATRILVDEQTMKKMNPTFRGRPVFAEVHRDVALENVEDEADGYVIRSFFNPMDGMSWAEFLVTSDAGHEAIQKGWQLSNCYNILESEGPGTCINVPYDQRVVTANYDHLAIVENPRYEQSVILTLEEFKAYNAQKETELAVLANSKEKKKMAFNLFKKQKLQNQAELADAVVELDDGREMKLSEIIEKVKNSEEEKKRKAKNEVADPAAADGAVDLQSKISVGAVSMTISELISKYQELLAAEGGADDRSENESDESDEEKRRKAKRAEEGKAANDSEEDDDDEKKKKMKNEKALRDAEKLKNFEKLKNAKDQAQAEEPTVVDTHQDQIQRGKERYSF